MGKKVHKFSHDEYEGGEIFLGKAPLCWTEGDVIVTKDWRLVTCTRCKRAAKRDAARKGKR